MEHVIPHGNVLLLAADPSEGDRMRRFIEAVGERAVVLPGAEKFLMERGDDDTVDLLVTDLNAGDPAARSLLERLITGDLFPGIPQLHLFRDPDLRQKLEQGRPALSALSLPSPPPIGEFQARVRLAAEIGRLRRELHRSGIRDALTGVANRRHLLNRLEEEFSRARRYRAPLSLVLFDVDHLKQINDAFGQSAGDSVIRGVAQVLRAQVRKEDVVGRMGEESFGIVLPGNRYRGAAVFANKVRRETEEFLLRFDRENAQVRISAGICCYPDNAAIRGAEDLVRTTENALTQAKARGGNRVFIDEGVLRQERPVVLVADADRSLLDLAEDLLALDDLRVIRADSARAALETLRFRRPDLLVLDLQMTREDGGPTLVEKLQGLGAIERFPIIGLSRESGGETDSLSRLDVDRFITKPFSLTVLRSVARELLLAAHSPV